MSYSKCLEKRQKSRNVASFYIEDQIRVSIIDSIPHCHTENALERGKNQEMLISFCVGDKVGVSIIDSFPHCHTENALKRVNKSRNVAPFLYRGQSWSFYHR